MIPTSQKKQKRAFDDRGHALERIDALFEVHTRVFVGWTQQQSTVHIIVKMRRANRPEPSSDLWDLVLDMNWQEVIVHAREQPQDANFVEGHWHETPLYLACQHEPPIEALSAIIEAHPESVRIASRENQDLPIHIACRYQASTAILEALLKHFPETALVPTKWGRTPITTLCDARRKENKDATLIALCDDKEFWNKVLVVLSAIARTYHNGVPYMYSEISSRDVNPGDAKMEFAPFLAPLEEESTFFVHAAVSLGAQGCPVEVLSSVMKKYPEQVFQRDQWGRLPLHVGIQRITWSKHRKRRLKPKEQPFLTVLLDAFPLAAREQACNDNGRYPLHSAIANGHAWEGGIRDIFLAAPEILSVRDPISGLFPFQLAALPAVAKISKEMDSFETSYRLLRARPDIIDRIQPTGQGKKKSGLHDRTTEVLMSRRGKRLSFSVIATFTRFIVGFVGNTIRNARKLRTNRLDL